MRITKQSKTARVTGALIVNADDWGRSAESTDRTVECISAGSLSSVSAMVFMADSARASHIAKAQGIDAGLHLNLTCPFNASNVSPALACKQHRLFPYLRRHRLSHVIFHPGLANEFEYVVLSQFDEYERLYGRPPERIDGHHHMHLCANVIHAKLLPPGTIVRRNFSFAPGEKFLANLVFRRFVDRRLASRHILTDYFFSLIPLELRRLAKICSLAAHSVVEVETHPLNPPEYAFLTQDGFHRLMTNLQIAKHYVVKPELAANWS
jgi:predicted glycoside hydrolase/deacetylase ChbG (UPF0249 family)